MRHSDTYSIWVQTEYSSVKVAPTDELLEPGKLVYGPEAIGT